MVATFIDVRDAPDTDRHPKALVTGVTLSLALHLGIAAWLTFAPWARPETPPPEFVVDVVQLPKPAPPTKPPEPPPPAPPAPQSLPPPPPPQLTEAPIAEKSAPPPHDSPVKAPPRDKAGVSHERGKALVARAENSLRPTTKASEAEPIAREHGEHDATPEGVGGKATETASQTVQDFILMQIARVWIIDLHSPRFRGLEITWGFTLRPDGTLAPPFGKDDPWDLQRMVNTQTYEAMQQQTEQGRIFRTAVTTFLQALRQAQPFRVPPNEKSYKDRVLPLRFRAGDLAQSPAEAGR